MDFQDTEYNTHGIFNNLRCYGFFSQRFKWQSLQSCHLGIRNFIKFGMYFASISLFENRAMSNALSRISYNKIVEYRMGILGIDSSSSKQYVERKPIFAFCEKASYVSFLLFVLALTACAIYKICYT